jgi:hypothetical protein
LDRPPISAHLLLDERMKGDVGIISEDLLRDLFPGYKRSEGKTLDGPLQMRRTANETIMQMRGRDILFYI